MSLLILREREPRFGFNNFDFDTDEFLWPLKIASLVNGHQRRLTESNKKILSRKRKFTDAFEVNVDVQQFKPEELTVKVVENTVFIEGTHEERPDEHGFISRSFKRRYVVPEGYDLDKIESSLSSDGVLTLTAPKVNSIQGNERIIPIIHSGPVRQQIKEKDKEINEESKENEKKRKKEE